MADKEGLFGTNYQRVTTPAEFERGMLGQAAADGIAMASMLPSNPLAAAASLGVAQAPVLAEMGTSSLRKLFNLEDPRVTEAQEAQRQSNRAFRAKANAELARVQAAFQNTTDARVRRELAALIPLVRGGEIGGEELSNLLSEIPARYEIKPMTATQRTSYENFINEDPELMKLIEEPSFLSRVFGSEATPETGREALISELHILQQQNPNLPLGQLADTFLESMGPKILQVEGVGDLSELPVEEISQLPEYSEEMDKPFDVEEQATAIRQARTKVENMLKARGYPSDSPTGQQRYRELLRSELRKLGIEPNATNMYGPL